MMVKNFMDTSSEIQIKMSKFFFTCQEICFLFREDSDVIKPFEDYVKKFDEFMERILNEPNPINILYMTQNFEKYLEDFEKSYQEFSTNIIKTIFLKLKNLYGIINQQNIQINIDFKFFFSQEEKIKDKDLWKKYKKSIKTDKNIDFKNKIIRNFDSYIKTGYDFIAMNYKIPMLREKIVKFVQENFPIITKLEHLHNEKIKQLNEKNTILKQEFEKKDIKIEKLNEENIILKQKLEEKEKEIKDLKAKLSEFESS